MASDRKAGLRRLAKDGKVETEKAGEIQIRSDGKEEGIRDD